MDVFRDKASETIVELCSVTAFPHKLEVSITYGKHTQNTQYRSGKSVLSQVACSDHFGLCYRYPACLHEASHKSSVLRFTLFKMRMQGLKVKMTALKPVLLLKKIKNEQQC